MRDAGKLVTIGIPIYKRLQYLPHVLRLVQAQDYPWIELLVSDNGLIGAKLKELIDAHYSRPYRLRRNPATVNISTHFNQLIHEAAGEYFALLADDDEISLNFVSSLMRRLEQHPEAAIAIARQESFNEQGQVIRQSSEDLPEMLSGPDFIRAVWPANQFNFDCFSTFVAKTSELRRCGGYPDFTRGNHNENALLIKACIGSGVVFSREGLFRWRVDESSNGWSVSSGELAAACRELIRFLDEDPTLRQFAQTRPGEWKELRALLVRMAWETYLARWRSIYRNRMSGMAWTKAAFAMPFIPAYYWSVAPVFLQSSKEAVVARMKRLLIRPRPAGQSSPAARLDR